MRVRRLEARPSGRPNGGTAREIRRARDSHNGPIWNGIPKCSEDLARRLRARPRIISLTGPNRISGARFRSREYLAPFVIG